MSGAATAARPSHHKPRRGHHSRKHKQKRKQHRVTGQQCARLSDCAAIYDFSTFSPSIPGVTPQNGGFTVESHAVFGLGAPVVVICDDGFSEVRTLGSTDIPVDAGGHFSYSDETDYPLASPPGQFQRVSGEGQLSGNNASGTHTFSYVDSPDNFTLRHCSGTVQWTAKVSYFSKKYNHR